MGFAFLCWLSALLIPPTGEGAPRLKITPNIAASTAATIRHLRADPRLWWGAMVTSWFWLTGIVVLALLPPLIKVLIGGDENTVTAYLALFSVAVGAGSGAAALIARRSRRLPGGGVADADRRGDGARVGDGLAMHDGGGPLGLGAHHPRQLG